MFKRCGEPCLNKLFASLWIAVFAALMVGFYH